MKNLIYIFISVILFLPFRNTIAQTPTYNLRILNQTILDPSNSMEFDIYIEHTNPPVLFEYMGGQYFIPFNPEIGNGEAFTLSIVGSDLPVNMIPRSPSVGNASNPSATLMRLAANVFPGSGNGYIITSHGSPGTKIARVRLTVLTGKLNCDSTYYNLGWRNPPIILFATKIFAYISGLGYDITTSATHYPSIGLPVHCTTLYLKVEMLLEGFYNIQTNTLNRKEFITAFLRDPIAPYTLRDSSGVYLDSVSRKAIFQFTKAPSGNYYVQLKHLNSLETWTKVPLLLQEQWLPPSVQPPPEYSLTLFDTAAYGNNLKLKGTKFCIYTGDVNKDGVIDGTDLIAVDNDANKFISGFNLPTDLDGDNFVDGSDLSICDNNAFDFVSAITPLDSSAVYNNILVKIN